LPEVKKKKKKKRKTGEGWTRQKDLGDRAPLRFASVETMPSGTETG